MNNSVKGGLEGVVAGTSSICEVDGIEGRLSYRGIQVQELAAHSTFEETAYLVWCGHLPSGGELAELESRLASSRELPSGIEGMLREFPETAEPMEVLRTVVSALGVYYHPHPHGNGATNLDRAVGLTSVLPTVIASRHRICRKLEPIPPRRDLTLGANFLYMLEGQTPAPSRARILDRCMILHADHELNASTFAARVAAATLADMFSAVTAALAALAGPLHGGANEQAMRMLESVGEPSRAEEHVRGLLARGQKVPGFGHRVYRTEDPRASQLKRLVRDLAEETGEEVWPELLQAVEASMWTAKGLLANIDFYSAPLYRMLGIPTDLFTPVFACSRIVGWTAHILEQYANNRLIRPRAEYVGPRDVPYVPMAERH